MQSNELSALAVRLFPNRDSTLSPQPFHLYQRAQYLWALLSRSSKTHSDLGAASRAYLAATRGRFEKGSGTISKGEKVPDPFSPSPFFGQQIHPPSRGRLLD